MLWISFCWQTRGLSLNWPPDLKSMLGNVESFINWHHHLFIYLFTSVTEIRVNGEQLLMFVMELLKKSCSQMWQTNWLKHGEPQFKGFGPWGKIIIQSKAHLTTTVLALTHFNQVFQNMVRRGWGVWREKKKSMHWYWLSPPPPTGNTHHAPLFTINVLKVLVSCP